MDRDRFDHLTRGLASATTRRSALRGIAAGALALGAGRGVAMAAACGGGAGSAKKKAKTCICHVSGGSLEGEVLCLGGKAADKHLKHGDARCDGLAATCIPETPKGEACTVNRDPAICDPAKVCRNDNDCTVDGSNDTCRCGEAAEPGGDRLCAAVVG